MYWATAHKHSGAGVAMSMSICTMDLKGNTQAAGMGSMGCL